MRLRVKLYVDFFWCFDMHGRQTIVKDNSLLFDVNKTNMNLMRLRVKLYVDVL